MCHYKSAIVLQSGEVVHSPFTDSHEDLIRLAGNPRDTGDALVRVELRPQTSWTADPWELHIDQHDTPDWFDAHVRGRVYGTLWDVVQRSIVREPRDILVGGAWVFAPGAGARKIVGGRVIYGRQADLRNTEFVAVSCIEADLRGADLWEADLRGADLQEANLQGAYLRGANLQGIYLRGADLQGANLQGANLRRADLQGANLRGAGLREANLQRADLREANLRRADLLGVDLRGADLDRTDLTGTILEQTGEKNV